MKPSINFIVLLAILLATVSIPFNAEASEGLPGSPKFGYGARIDVNGDFLAKSIETASMIGLDWIAVDFNWSEMWPDPSSHPILNDLTDIILHANQAGLSVLLSISNPADWVLNQDGPDPQTTANLIRALVDYYSGIVLAVELFPGVNTKDSWKADPNPTNYLNLLKKTHESLIQASEQIALVTTVTPEAISQSSSDISDLEFLSSLYTLGAKPYLEIVGVKFYKITGEPLTDPSLSTLRHYEQIRSIMLIHEHNYGTIWITGFRLPEFSSDRDYKLDQVAGLAEEQSNWIEEAYKLMRSQLYIGVSFFDQLNPHNDSPNTPQITIITEDSTHHLIADRIMRLIEDFKYSNQPIDTHSSNQVFSNRSNGNENFLSALLKKILTQLNIKRP